MTQHVIAVVSVILLVLLAGCVSITMDLTVDEDGTVELEQRMVFDEEVVPDVLELIELSGQESISGAMAADLGDEWEVIDFEDTLRDDGSLEVWLHARSHVDDIDGMMVTVTDNRVLFVSDGFVPEFDDGDEFLDLEVDFVFRVIMPGTIVETNGETVSDRTVEWRLPDHADQVEFHVTSERATTGDADENPGFGVVIAIVAIAALAALVNHRRRR